ncbi:MAG TPA: cyclase family protein [Candidatus Nanoarchaeia archaeon]|nr:cyclase family protein [Candidatus Nanoarchaeia archaeon]
MKIIDISVPVNDTIPVWPKAARPDFPKFLSMERGDVCNDSNIRMGMHTGTHIDAPLHFVKNGKSIDSLPLETFIGDVLVVELPDANEISAEQLDSLTIPENTERILFKTKNSKLWGATNEFAKDYVGISITGAEWLAKKSIKLIGVDYLSIAKYEEAADVHKILLGKGIALLEGINLSQVESGVYQLSCLPIKFTGLEAAPVRAILIK